MLHAEGVDLMDHISSHVLSLYALHLIAGNDIIIFFSKLRAK